MNSTKQITVHKTASETLLDGQQIHDMGPVVVEVQAQHLALQHLQQLKIMD